MLGQGCFFKRRKWHRGPFFFQNQSVFVAAGRQKKKRRDVSTKPMAARDWTFQCNR